MIEISSGAPMLKTWRRLPDIRKVEAAVGWTPTRTLDEILVEVIDFHQAEAAVV
jgi:nucleoside-diphosphate-sugar epimerase